MSSDEFRLRYSNLVIGGYDCVDRIVLNAFFPLGYIPGGLRIWWRRWHGDSDAELDNTHLMRLAGRTATEPRESATIRVWAHTHGYQVARHGRIPADIVDAFRAAG